jgi:hypothetical protein
MVGCSQRSMEVVKLYIVCVVVCKSKKEQERAYLQYK